MKDYTKAMLVLGGLGILILGVLVWRFPYALRSQDSLLNLIWCLLILAAMVPALVSRLGAAQALKYGGAWGGIFLLLLIGYGFQEEVTLVGERVKSSLFSAQGARHRDGRISFRRAADGHFYIEASVNDVLMRFMVDTGATKVALTPQDAKRLGFDREGLSYTHPVQTANGVAFTAPVRLQEIRIGPIVVQDVNASVSQGLEGHSLLGMSFLKKLKGFNIEGDRLTLEAPLP